MNAKADPEVQQVMHMGYLCQKLRVLPGPGGLFEQDSLVVWLLTVYFECVAEREERDTKKAEQKAQAARAKRR